MAPTTPDGNRCIVAGLGVGGMGEWDDPTFEAAEALTNREEGYGTASH